MSAGRAVDAASEEFIARLRAFARKRVRTAQDAEDVVQDVLTKLVRWDASVEPRSAEAWLFAVTRRTIIDRARAQRSAQPLPEDTLRAPDIAEEQTAIAELARCVEPMLTRLAPSDRALLERVDRRGASQADLARELGLSASGFKSRVQRARRRFRRVLEACCALDLDRRGVPVDVARRPGDPAGCDAGPCANDGP